MCNSKKLLIERKPGSNIEKNRKKIFLNFPLPDPLESPFDLQNLSEHLLEATPRIKNMLAKKISEGIKEYASSGHMIAKTPEEILESFSFIVFTNPEKNEIIGFYEIREHNFRNEIYWEMGSVISKRPNFFQVLLLDFLKRQKEAGVKRSFLITKNEKLAEKSGGTITNFPSDFPWNKEDRFFVLLSNKTSQPKANLNKDSKPKHFPQLLNNRPTTPQILNI